MLVALRLEQPALLYEAMSSLGAVDPAIHDPDEVERAFARFLAAYLGPDLPPPEALIDLMRLTTELGLRMPRSTMAMFRALATLSGTLEHLSPGYPVIEAVARMGGVQFTRRILPGSISDYIKQEWAQLGPLAGRLPRHIDRIATMLEHGRITTRMRVFAEAEDRRFLMTLVNRVVLSLLSIGTGVVSVMLISLDDRATFSLLGDLGAYELLGWIGMFISITLLLRILLAVLRSDRGGRKF
jgi:ubiquinone biosynthesis protein